MGFCVPADQPVGPGDRFLAAELSRREEAPSWPSSPSPTRSTGTRLGAQLLAVSELGDWAEVLPVSAVTGIPGRLLTDLLVQRLPEGPNLYLEGELTDEPEVTLVAELIREAALEGVRDELPHSIAVVVEEMVPREGRADGLIDVYATIYVERASQKPIVLGRGGARMKDIGTRSRAAISRVLGSPVFLDLHVKIAKEWQRDPKQLRRLGF